MTGVSAIFTTLFLGGWQGPFVEQVPVLGLVYFWAKVIASVIFMIWLRSTHPRLRYDRLMAFGWKVLLPLSLLNVMVTAAAMVFQTLISDALLGWVVGGLIVLGLVIGLFVVRRLWSLPLTPRRVRT